MDAAVGRDRSGAVMDPIRICSWCLGATPPTLTILDGTPPELALIALEADDAASISHGICADHRQRMAAGLA